MNRKGPKGMLVLDQSYMYQPTFVNLKIYKYKLLVSTIRAFRVISTDRVSRHQCNISRPLYSNFIPQSTNSTLEYSHNNKRKLPTIY